MSWRRSAAGLTGVVALAACSGASGPGAGGSRVVGADPASGGRVPAAPAETRWLGVDDVMLAVPTSWRVSTDECSDPRRSEVAIRDDRLTRPTCAARPTDDVAVTITRVDASRGFGDLREVETVHGLEVRHSGAGCRAGSAPTCALTFAVPDSHVLVSVTARPSLAQQVFRSLRGSLRSIPPGVSAVPLIRSGWSDAPDVDWPHYAIGTRPVAGTLLQEGATVELLPGDG